jgi:hypothetical protein
MVSGSWRRAVADDRVPAHGIEREPHDSHSTYRGNISSLCAAYKPTSAKDTATSDKKVAVMTRIDYDPAFVIHRTGRTRAVEHSPSAAAFSARLQWFMALSAIQHRRGLPSIDCSGAGVWCVVCGASHVTAAHRSARTRRDSRRRRRSSWKANMRDSKKMFESIYSVLLCLRRRDLSEGSIATSIASGPGSDGGGAVHVTRPGQTVR